MADKNQTINALIALLSSISNTPADVDPFASVGVSDDMKNWKPVFSNISDTERDSILKELEDSKSDVNKWNKVLASLAPILDVIKGTILK